MLNLKGYQGILKDTARLCSVYDSGIGMMYLKEVFTGYCEQEVVENVCSSYGAETVIDNLKDSELLIPRIYLLHAAIQQDNGTLDNYMVIYREIKEKLKEIIAEKIKIQESPHTSRVLLIEEIDRLCTSAFAILLEFLFAYYRIPRVSNLEKQLRLPEGKKMVCEIIKNSLPFKVSEEIICIIEEKIMITEQKYDYSALVTGGIHQILSNLYMVLGGESMEGQFSKEMETISILKRTSVFKNLDIESLYELLRIGEFSYYDSGDTVVRKDDTSDKLYIIIDGKVAVYRNDSGELAELAECGEMFGEEDVIESSPRISTVRTIGQTVLFCIKGDEFVLLAKTNNELSFSLLEALAAKLRSDMKAN
jgi:hypothetical protein